jgi:hypothetical protein
VRLKDLGAESFQLIQVAEDRFELKLVTAGRAEYERMLPEALQSLRELIGDVAIEPSFHETLPPGPRGLFRYVEPLRRSQGG